jgi:group I intron endonuclease
MVDLTEPASRTKFKWVPGIYSIRNTKNGKNYVGSSQNVGYRLMNHLSLLRNGKHSNKHLQRAWNKHGEASFVLELLESVPIPELETTEQKWIDRLDGFKLGYNASPVSGVARGFTFNHSEETKKLLSEMKKGVVFTEEHKQNLSLAHLGQPPSPQTIEKVKRLNTGKKRSPECKKLLSERRQRNVERASATTRKKNSRKNASGFKGVYQHRDKWQAKLNLHGEDFSVGRFDTREEAAQNYDYHMLNLYGRGNCFLNFPDFDYKNFVPKKATLNEGGHNKVGDKVAKAIRDLHDKGISVKTLSDRFKITEAAIYNIINYVSYPKPKDTAIVGCIYSASGKATIDLNTTASLTVSGLQGGGH